MSFAQLPGSTLDANDSGPPLSPLRRETLRTVPGQRILLFVILALFVVIAFIHAERAPFGATGYQDAPDEAAHVSFVRVISSGRLPSRDTPGVPPTDPTPSYEWHQPPLYYAAASLFLRFGEKQVRYFSILIGVACILAIYAAAVALFPERPEAALIACGFAALIPGHCAILSTVNNDGLLELGFSGVFLVLLLILTRGLTLSRSIVLGIILGAALLTKATAVLLIPLIAVSLFLTVRIGASWREVGRSAFVAFTIAAVISGWWFARNGVLYHEWLPLAAFKQSFEGTAKAVDVVQGRTGLPANGWLGYAGLVAVWSFQSFFAVFSTARGAQWGVPSFLPVQLYVLAGLVSVACLGGLATLWTRRKSEFTQAQRYGLAILLGGCGLVLISFALFTSRYFQAQGRYFYPVMLPVSILAALGWRAVIPQRYGLLASALLAAFLFAFCLALLRFAD